MKFPKIIFSVCLLKHFYYDIIYKLKDQNNFAVVWLCLKRVNIFGVVFSVGDISLKRQKMLEKIRIF